MNATDILVREHALVLRGIDLLERAAAAFSGERDVPPDVSTTLISFFEEFLDVHHHQKEEQGLFPAMLAAGFPRQGGPVPVMLQEHDAGRELVRELREVVAGQGSRSPRFAEPARRFVVLLREHIAKENGVLFPMSQRFVPRSVAEELSARWSQGAEVEARWRGALDGVERALADVERAAAE